MPRVKTFALLTLMACAGTARADPLEPYYQLVYDYEIASFCGLVRAPVHKAYKLKRADLEAASSLSADELTKVRVGAMADAEREYINRGLGGHRPWCRKDGTAGVKRILGNE